MNKDIKKQILLGSLVALTSIILVIGGSFAWFTIAVEGEKTHAITTNGISLIIKDEANAINLEGAFPTTEENGLTKDPYLFSIENKSTTVLNYIVRIVDDEESKLACIEANNGECKIIPDSAIRYKIEVDNEEKSSSLLSENNRIIDDGSINKNQTIDYKLWLWLDIDATNDAQGAYFYGKIEVEVIQNMDSNLTPDDCFVFDSSTGTITDYLCYMENTNNLPEITSVIIPETIGGVEVNVIGSSAFSSKSLTSVHLPETITTLESYAFKNNVITSINIPTSVNVIGQAVLNTNQLPDSQAFLYARNSDGSIDETTIISYGGAKRDNVVVPNTAITITTAAFNGNNITSVTLPNGLTTIQSYAFRNNNLQNVTIPSTVTSIGVNAFGKTSSSNTELTIIYNKTNNPFNWGSITGGSDTTSVFSSGTVTHANGNITVDTTSESCFTFSGGTISDYTCSDTSVIIPSTIGGVSVTTLGAESFRSNSLTSVVIPSGVTSIGNSAFRDNSLTTITIPNTVTTIGQMAFMNNKLTGISVPTSVTSIGYAAFNDNQLPDSQAFIYARKSDGSIDERTIISYGGSQRSDVYIPNWVTTIGTAAFVNNKLTSITLLEKLTTIGDYAFSENNLTCVAIPSTVTNIGTNAFIKTSSSNSGLTRILNKTNKSFNFGSITGGSDTTSVFSSGTVTHSSGNITVTAALTAESCSGASAGGSND